MATPNQKVARLVVVSKIWNRGWDSYANGFPINFQILSHPPGGATVFLLRTRPLDTSGRLPTPEIGS
jgi:hypothetical protein